eukprot:TRINITY_DN71262_c0_g1_i1.p3 TRINITY_DN71262_c0_g1~~TRINITY_DN71262_c0_g1_i1.p3  ORF type:complete len:105 (+),score=9.20 TRINITY_DN71262_c0_g1_i1:217-531(+)
MPKDQEKGETTRKSVQWHPELGNAPATLGKMRQSTAQSSKVTYNPSESSELFDIWSGGSQVTEMRRKSEALDSDISLAASTAGREGADGAPRCADRCSTRCSLM